MYSIDPEEVKELEFRHLKFRHKLIYGRRNRRTHGNIQVSFFCPKICLVCGSSQITGYRKLLNDKGFRNITKGIRVSVCKNHLYDDEKMRANLEYALLCGSTFLVLLDLIFEWFFFLEWLCSLEFCCIWFIV